MSLRSKVGQREQDARDTYGKMSGDLDALLADVDDTLTSTALVEPWLADAMDGSTEPSPCDPEPCQRDHEMWESTAMRWAPPPGPGEEDPYADPKATERFRAQVADPTPRPEPTAEFWMRDPQVRAIEAPHRSGQLYASQMDLLLFGHAYATEDGERIDPTTIIRSRIVPGEFYVVPRDQPLQIRPSWASDLSQGTHDHPAVFDLRARGRSATLTLSDVNMDTLRLIYGGQMPEPTPEIATRIGRAFRQVRDAFRPMTDAMLKLARAIEKALPSEPPTGQRDRALYLHQSRNTGPDHEPFPHRGGITRERVPDPRGSSPRFRRSRSPRHGG